RKIPGPGPPPRRANNPACGRTHRWETSSSGTAGSAPLLFRAKTGHQPRALRSNGWLQRCVGVHLQIRYLFQACRWCSAENNRIPLIQVAELSGYLRLGVQGYGGAATFSPMALDASNAAISANPAAAFATTHWSVVLSAAGEDSSLALLAMEKLARAYWYPLYVYVRRKGHDSHTAEDLTQEFFPRVVSRNFFARVDRTKGRFRSWLLGAMNHFLAHEWEKARTQKRGGGATWVPLDEAQANERYVRLLAVETTPEHL